MTSPKQALTRRPSHLSSKRRWLLLPSVYAVGLAVLLGSALGAQTTLVFAVVLTLIALPLVNASPLVWVGLALAVTWTSRLFTTTGLAPRFLDFLDFPLVIMAFLTATAAHLASGRVLPAAQRMTVRCVAVVALVVAISWSFNDPQEPERLLAALVFALQPFLLLVAVIIAPMTLRQRHLLTLVALALLCGQLPFSLAQIASGAVSDDVKGTLLSAGAGHHVSAGGLVLGFFLLVGLRTRKPILAAYGVASLLVVVLSDTKQVLFILPLALLVLGVSRSGAGSVTGLIRGVAIGGVMATVSAYALLSYESSATAFDFLERSATNRTGKVAVSAALWSDISESKPSFLFGLGPGQSVSRFAFLSTPNKLKAGSPVALLGLTTSRGADRYDEIAFGGRFTGDSSFTSAQSSALGILGDYGIAGVAAFGATVGFVIRALRREGAEGLKAAALACWALTLPLAVVFDWLEQPPFTLAVMVITGLAMRRVDTLQGVAFDVQDEETTPSDAVRLAGHRPEGVFGSTPPSAMSDQGSARRRKPTSPPTSVALHHQPW